jgi:hypothetical protein
MKTDSQIQKDVIAEPARDPSLGRDNDAPGTSTISRRSAPLKATLSIVLTEE